MASQGRCSAMLMVMAVLVVVSAVEGATHTVGGASGWKIPGTAGTNATYLEDWAKSQTFTAGDTVVFVYTASMHSVYTLDAASYAGCTISSPLLKSTTGNDSLTLAEGSNYYVCGVPGHCTIGQKIVINATAAASTPPGTISPPASPGTPATPASGNNAAGTGVTFIQVAAAVVVSMIALG